MMDEDDAEETPRARGGQGSDDELARQPFVVGRVEIGDRQLPQVRAELTGADRIGHVKVRCGIGRMNYKVLPGLYALNSPDESSPVLVSANYKLSFDALRAPLGDVDAWILVVDTQGINVWCAAAKGFFSTDEVVARIEATGLESIVSHHRLVLPQLCGPGVVAHEIKKRTPFRARWGPVDSADIPAFLDAKMKADASMRLKHYPLRDRAVLIPNDLTEAIPMGLLIGAVLTVAGCFGFGTDWETSLWSHGVPFAIAPFAAVFAGLVLTPLLLPWLPGRAFAFKALWPALALCAIKALVQPPWGDTLAAVELAAWSVLTLAVASFVGMNFTGSSTFTSLSGVRKETAIAGPLQGLGVVAGLALWIAARFVS